MLGGQNEVSVLSLTKSKESIFNNPEMKIAILEFSFVEGFCYDLKECSRLSSFFLNGRLSLDLASGSNLQGSSKCQ